MTTKLVWITPEAEKTIAYCARVSNPSNQDNENIEGLLRYCIRNKHWSIFEMASMCIEINTSRDIARQILRHRSFHFQEFSQRYADVSLLGEMVDREARKQDPANRQNSIPVDPEGFLQLMWERTTIEVWTYAKYHYQSALNQGIAKEVARALLPEGLTRSKMYMSGTLRDWLHYVDIRTGNGTQKEHILIAEQIRAILKEQVPTIYDAMFNGE